MMKFELSNDKGKPISPFAIALGYVTFLGRDGDAYRLRTADTDCTLERKDGMVWPTSGKLHGKKISPHSMEEAQTGFIKMALSGAVATENPNGSVTLKTADDFPARLSVLWLAGFLRKYAYEVEPSGERRLEIKGEAPRGALKGICKGLGLRIRWVRKLKDD